MPYSKRWSSWTRSWGTIYEPTAAGSSKFLSLFEYAQNSLTEAFSNLMPFQRVLGYQPLDPRSEEPSDIPTVDDCGKAPMCTSNRQFATNAYRPTTGDVHTHGTNQDSTRSDPTPTPPIEVDRSPAYLVQLIMDSQQRRGHLQYLIDWERYSPEEQWWVFWVTGCTSGLTLLDIRTFKHAHVTIQNEVSTSLSLHTKPLYFCLCILPLCMTFTVFLDLAFCGFTLVRFVCFVDCLFWFIGLSACFLDFASACCFGLVCLSLCFDY